MIALRGRAISINLPTPLGRSAWLLVDVLTLGPQRRARAFLLEHDGQDVPRDFDLYVAKSNVTPPIGVPFVQLPAPLDYLGPGDVLSTGKTGDRLRVLWRRGSRQNSILLTERCDHYCLMCSQPPKPANDDWLLNEAFELIRVLPRESRDIGFTGGEPTIYGTRLFNLLSLCGKLLPDAAVHVLSNGRRFADPSFAASWATIDNPNMMVGIPIYGSEPALHDYVVQAQGAFNDTVLGILNLAELQQRIELRVVVHKQTAPHLVEIAEFISRNLPFVEQVAWMGLEMIGLARANIDSVWIDPNDYRQQLTEAVTLLDRRGLKTMVYNHQLCLIDRAIWPLAVKSISDWKNEYHQECLNCNVINDCGGFFFSAKYGISDHIKAISHEESARAPRMLLETQP
jgi:His-Xaa-Ser system radical SAM maturase HxsC